GPPPTIFGVVIPPAAIPIGIVLFAFVSPYLTGKLSNKVQTASSDMQGKMLALNSLVTGAMQSPEEIQAMEAEPIFSEKHDKQLAALLRARLKSTYTIEVVGLVNGLPSWVIQVVLVGFGVFMAFRSGNAGAAGNVVSILLLAPQLMQPIGGISAYIVMAGMAWPRIKTVTDMMESCARRGRLCGRQSLRPHRDDVAIPRFLLRHLARQHDDGQTGRDRRRNPRHLRADRRLENSASRRARQSSR